MRKTLVFRHIPEHESEKKWSATKDLLATKISDVMEDVDKSEALQMIDRCHRGGKKTDETTDKPSKHRPIYAAMLYWEDCESLLQAARKSKPGFYIDYKYGRKTTARRNEALKKRKELKAGASSIMAF